MDKSGAQKIIDKITDRNINSAYSKGTDASKDPNKTNINQALLKDNPSLTQAEASTFVFVGTLSSGQASSIVLTATKDGSKASVTIQVSMDKSSAQKIIDKIDTKLIYSI